MTTAAFHATPRDALRAYNMAYGGGALSNSNRYASVVPDWIGIGRRFGQSRRMLGHDFT
jgi:hypothetical protein